MSVSVFSHFSDNCLFANHVVFLHLLYLALQFFNIGVPFLKPRLGVFVGTFQFFQFSLPEREATPPASYDCCCRGGCLFTCQRDFPYFTCSSSCRQDLSCLLLCAVWLHRCVAVQPSWLLKFTKSFRSRCSLPVTAFRCPRFHQQDVGCRVCIPASCHRHRALAFLFRGFIQLKTIWA